MADWFAMTDSSDHPILAEDERSLRKEVPRLSHGDWSPSSSYLGSGANFDRALGEFAIRYARQNELDYEAFVTEIREGRLEAAELE